MHITIGDGGNREGLASQYSSFQFRFPLNWKYILFRKLINYSWFNVVLRLNSKYGKIVLINDSHENENRYEDPASSLSVFREASFGHGEFVIYNATHAHWTWHRNEDDESVTSDEVWMNSLAAVSNSF